VFQGTVTSDSQVTVSRDGHKERLGQLLKTMGKESKPSEALVAGDVGAIAKLKDVVTGDTLHADGVEGSFPAIAFPAPLMSFAITAKSKGEEDKVITALRRLSDEDRLLEVHHDDQTGEMIVGGMSQVHVEVTVERMKRRFGVEVELKPPRVPYRETIKGTAKAEGKHKKQTGGRGQFGDCWIEVEPQARGEGYQFEDAIFGGSIPRNFIPAVEKGVVEAMEHGVIAGYPVVDVKVKLFDGSYHNVDSSELAFKLAGGLAWNKAMESAAPVLLEPIMNVEVIAPEENMGDIMGDLSSRRGRPQGSENMGEMDAIRAQVPLAEMLTYAPQLRSMTAGRGSFTLEFDHYDEVPAQLVDKIVAEVKARKAAD
jgi:elongation factor G